MISSIKRFRYLVKIYASNLIIPENRGIDT